MKPTIDHVILTRFNLPSKGAESLIRAREGWLRDRQQLFETYCLPSIMGQSNRDFTWVIYFDPQSPQWLLDRISEFQRRGHFVPIFREEVTTEQLIDDLRRVTGGRAEVLLTTNLDNDDGLSLDFVQRLHQSIEDASTQAFYIDSGLIQYEDKVYLRKDPSNAFCSVSSSWANPQTCWMDWHNHLYQHMPVVNLAGAPGWLQVIHSSNVSNRIRGVRVSPTDYRKHFAGELHNVDDLRPSEMAWEKLVLLPARQSGEKARLLAKKGILLLGGRSLLNRVKTWRQIVH